MILGIDPGMAAVGWAVIDPPTSSAGARLIALGVITTEQDNAISMNLDRQRRIAVVGHELAGVAAAHSCSAIAAEDMLAHGNIHAVIPQVLCWGAITRVAGELGLELRAVRAKDWQHEVVPGLAKVTKKKRYARVLVELRAYAGDELLAGVMPDLQTHALDAVGVAVFAAVKRSRALRVCAARTA